MEKLQLISKSNLEVYTAKVKEKLSERISEPTVDGKSANVLATDGKGGRYWLDIGIPEDYTKEEIKAIFE